MYLAFANSHYVQTRGEHDDFIPTLSYQRLQVDRVMDEKELREKIERTVSNENQQKVMLQFLTFNSHVL
jgi:glutamate dehydrogenase